MWSLGRRHLEESLDLSGGQCGRLEGVQSLAGLALDTGSGVGGHSTPWVHGVGEDLPGAGELAVPSTRAAGPAFVECLLCARHSGHTSGPEPEPSPGGTQTSRSLNVTHVTSHLSSSDTGWGGGVSLGRVSRGWRTAGTHRLDTCEHSLLDSVWAVHGARRGACPEDRGRRALQGLGLPRQEAAVGVRV